MKNEIQMVVGCAFMVGACRAEPSRAPGPGKGPSRSPAASTPAVSAPAEPAPSAPPTPPAERAPNADTGSKGRPFTKAFDLDAANAPPTGFSFARTGSGALGKWLVKADGSAPSGPHVLAQLDADNTSFRFPVAVADEPILSDVRVSVRCKLISGRVDQACGLVARYQDENNYFVTRANALEDNIRLYTVRDGKRSELASHDVEVTPNAWHDYRLEVRGDHLQVFWDGQRVLEHHDAALAAAGRVGLWTKADAITHFDDLRAEAYE